MIHRILPILLLIGLSLGTACAPADETAAANASSAENAYPQGEFTTSAGKSLSLADARGRAATVLICLATDCPISNEYTPALNELADRYRPKGVNFAALDPSAGQTIEEMAEYASQFKLAFPFLLDAGAKVARQFQFQVTPEVCVFDPQGKLVYRGRIDDRYRARSGSGQVTSRDLERALDEVLSGQPVSVDRTKPVGCPVQLSKPTVEAK